MTKSETDRIVQKGGGGGSREAALKIEISTCSLPRNEKGPQRNHARSVIALHCNTVNSCFFSNNFGAFRRAERRSARASATGPYTRRGTGILPVMYMAGMAMPRL